MARFDRLTPQFDPICLRGVKSKSRDGRGIFTNLTDLTGFLSLYTRAQACVRARTLALPALSPENIGQIGQMAFHPFAVLWFAFDCCRSNGGQTGGQIGVSAA
jgi:hypothetical protein